MPACMYPSLRRFRLVDIWYGGLREGYGAGVSYNIPGMNVVVSVHVWYI